jgi:dihydrofolate synthase / folylpolyglutamate synthase
MLASILQEQGYTVGLFTSPHIFDFRERIKINGVEISEQFVIEIVAQAKEVIATLQPSFFELTTAMAFCYFASQKIDVAVIEVGMGGLLDSTNIITPEVAVITNIGLDHTQFLGTTLSEIAMQKGGIIKNSIPVVVGANDEVCIKAFKEIALKKNAPIYEAATVYDIVKTKEDTIYQYIKAVNKAILSIDTYQVALLGHYQLENIKTVLMTCDILNDIGIEIAKEAITKGLRNVKTNLKFRGRFDILQTKPTIIADVAHNEDGIKKLMHQITKMTFQKLHIICGFVQDKDVAKVMQHFPDEAIYYITQAHIPRAMAVTELSEYFTSSPKIFQSFENINDAILNAKGQANKDDLILICGSFFILAEMDSKYFIEY